MFGADVLLETLVANVRAVSFAETGYGFLYDRRTGETVAHPAFEMEASDDANAVAPQVSVYERDLPEFGAFEKIVDDGETLWTFQDVNNDYRYVVTVSLDEGVMTFVVFFFFFFLLLLLLLSCFFTK